MNPRQAGDPARSDATTLDGAAPDTVPRPEPTPPGLEASAEFEPLDWLRKNAVVMTAVLLIAASLVEGEPLEHSFFRLDDFFALEGAPTHGLTWAYLMRKTQGIWRLWPTRSRGW